MSVVVQKDVGSPTNLTVQLKRKVQRVMIEIAATGDHKITIAYDEWRDDGNGVVGSVTRLMKTLLDADLPAGAKTDIDAVFTRALAAL